MRRFALLLLIAGCFDYGLTPLEVPEGIPGDTSVVWVTEAFEQGLAKGEPVDVLWLTDQSCSMDVDETGATHDAIRATVGAMPYADWRVWIGTTTEHDTPRGPVTASTSPEALDLTIDAGCSYMEDGLAAAFHHVEWGGFLRPDAHLLTVVVSDEDDHSADPVTWGAWYPTVRSEPWTEAAVIVGAIGGCGDPPVNYLSAGLEPLDLCADGWAAGMADRARFADERRVFVLQHEPDPVGMGVWVDGDPVLSYEVNGRRLVLGEAPPVGGMVVVRYLPL